MKYYYLDGIEKKGPYTSNEIVSKKLSHNTLIYREDKIEWLALSNFEELNPVDKLEMNTVKAVLNDESNHEKSEVNSHQIKIKLPKYTLLILIFIFSSLICSSFIIVAPSYSGLIFSTAAFTSAGIFIFKALMKTSVKLLFAVTF